MSTPRKRPAPRKVIRLSRTIRVDAEVAAWLKAEQKRTGKTPNQILKELLA
jgi:predicted DNA-binding protein